MSKQVQVGVTLTIKRPDGTVERKEVRKLGVVSIHAPLTARTFAAIVKATKDAGKGDVLSQEPIFEDAVEVLPTAADLAEDKYIRQRAAVERLSATGRA